MGIPVLILGPSGTGKSASLRNFTEKDSIGIFNVASKPLPFRSKLKTVNTDDYSTIKDALRRAKCKSYVIDDSQYLMAFQNFAQVNVKGYDKFTKMGIDFYNLVQTVIKETPADCIVYFLHHTELADDGTLKAKTIGKMLDNQLTLEGLFSIVLYAAIKNKNHVFITQSDGTNTAKSPMEMFDAEIDNDLKMVDGIIRNYYFEEEKKNG